MVRYCRLLDPHRRLTHPQYFIRFFNLAVYLCANADPSEQKGHGRKATVGLLRDLMERPGFLDGKPRLDGSFGSDCKLRAFVWLARQRIERFPFVPKKPNATLVQGVWYPTYHDVPVQGYLRLSNIPTIKLTELALCPENKLHVASKEFIVQCQHSGDPTIQVVGESLCELFSTPESQGKSPPSSYSSHKTHHSKIHSSLPANYNALLEQIASSR